MANKNTFSRFAYGDNYANLNDPTVNSVVTTRRPTFTGSDMFAYINNIPVLNLESCTWSISSEIIGDYVMGSPNAQAFRTGKRVIVGTMVFNQYDRHAIIEQVFQMTTSDSSKAIQNMGDLWDLTQNTTVPVQGRAAPTILGNNRGVNNPNIVLPMQGNDPNNNSYTSLGLRGLSPEEFVRQRNEQIALSRNLVRRRKVDYSDMLPIFDLTLVGVNKNQDTTSATIHGIQITQETTGVSSSDMTNSVGVSFTALAVSPFRPVTVNAAAISSGFGV